MILDIDTGEILGTYSKKVCLDLLTSFKNDLNMWNDSFLRGLRQHRNLCLMVKCYNLPVERQLFENVY